MPARDLPCADCGELMWRVAKSLPSGVARCQPCRRRRPVRKPPKPQIKNKRLTCAVCACPMFKASTSLPQGQATCLDCRRKAPGYRPVPTPTGWTPAVLACPVCMTVFTQYKYGQKYCTPECRQRRRGQHWAPKASASKRGYGSAHQRERRKWKPAVDAGLTTCSICERPIVPGTPWHLDHTDDRQGYRGVAHARCNTSAGGRRRHQVVRERRAKLRWAV